jgi:hypothetical protein
VLVIHSDGGEYGRTESAGGDLLLAQAKRNEGRNLEKMRRCSSQNRDWPGLFIGGSGRDMHDLDSIDQLHCTAVIISPGRDAIRHQNECER